MSEVIIRFLTLEAITVHPMVYAGLGAVWLIVLVATFLSIFSQPISGGWKVLWLVVVLILPILGVACYALRCLVRGDWSFLKPLKVQSPLARRPGSS